MSFNIPVSFLALASIAAAVPQYAHNQFHSVQPSGTGVSYGYNHQHHGYETGRPYPTSVYPANRNDSRPVYYPTGSYAPDEIKITSTSTTTIVKTVHISRSSSAVSYQKSSSVLSYQFPVVEAQAASTGGYDQCGPAVVTVTVSEKVTVTVGKEYGTPSSAPIVASPSSKYVAVSSSFVAPESSKPVEGYSAPSSKFMRPSSSKAVVIDYSSTAAYTPSSAAMASVSTPYSVVSSAAPSPSAPSTGSYSGSKRGLAYSDANMIKTLGGKYGFAWNWGQVENNDIGTMFIPMMHKPSDSTPEAWLANVDKAVKKGSTAVMGFNECDHGEQCDLTPEQACDAWRKYMNPIKAKYPQVTILGPSVTNGAAPMGLDWLTRFHSSCPDAAVDATNIHFYTIYQDKTNTQYSTTMDRLQSQVETAAKNYGKKVWVTEYGLNPGSANSDQAATFLKESLAYLDNAPEVQGYSYFMVGTDQSSYQLCEANGPSSYGKLYAASS